MTKSFDHKNDAHWKARTDYVANYAKEKASGNPSPNDKVKEEMKHRSLAVFAQHSINKFPNNTNKQKEFIKKNHPEHEYPSISDKDVNDALDHMKKFHTENWDYRRGPRALYDKNFTRSKPSEALDAAERKIKAMKITPPKFKGKEKLTDETVVESGTEIIPLSTRMSSDKIVKHLARSRSDFAKSKLQHLGYDNNDRSRKALELKNHYNMMSFMAHRALDRHHSEHNQVETVRDSMRLTTPHIPAITSDIRDALHHARKVRTDITLRKEEMSLVQRVRRLDEIFGLFGKKSRGPRSNIDSHELMRYYNMGQSHRADNLPRRPPTTAAPDRIEQYHLGYDDADEEARGWANIVNRAKNK